MSATYEVFRKIRLPSTTSGTGGGEARMTGYIGTGIACLRHVEGSPPQFLFPSLGFSRLNQFLHDDSEKPS